MFELDLERSLEMLRQGKTVLMPEANLWMAAVSLEFPGAAEYLMNLIPGQAQEIAEILVDDIAMLKDWTQFLHPRIETLLLYHTRPVAIFLPPIDQIPTTLYHPKGGVVCRVSLDSFATALIKRLGTPLAVLPILGSTNRTPVHFGGISSALIQQMDYVVKYRQQDRTAGELPVLVRLGTDEELEFLRD